MTSYSDVSLMIDGAWTKGANGRTIPVINPATEEVIGQVAHAEKSDLDRALAAAEKGFQQWRKVSPFDRYKIMRKAAERSHEATWRRVGTLLDAFSAAECRNYLVNSEYGSA